MSKECSVLLVDDDPDVLDSTKRMLILGGYSVLDAETFDDAIEILRDIRIGIDILVTDFNIDKMNGLDLSRLSFLMRPGLETLFVSGDPGSQACLRERVHFLSKPYTSQELHRKIASVLGKSKPSLGSTAFRSPHIRISS